MNFSYGIQFNGGILFKNGLLSAAALSALILTTGTSAKADSSSELFAKQWALSNTGQKACSDLSKKCQGGLPGKDIMAIKAWSIKRDCSNVVIAVLDSGVDTTHPDLRDNLIPGKNFTYGGRTEDPTDDNLHGTHVSGIIAGRGDSANGISGICPIAKLLPVKIGDAEGRSTDADIIAGIGFAASQGARVINMSFGGGGSSDVMKKTIQNASNTLVVTSAGNNGTDNDAEPHYPSSYGLPNMVAVAATDNRDSLAPFSNYGAKSVDIAAPGFAIMSTIPVIPTEEMQALGLSNSYASLDGTSMATPHVTGAAALLLSYEPNLTTSQLRTKLLASVDKLPNLNSTISTGGRLNLFNLLKK